MAFHNWVRVRRELYKQLRQAVLAIEGGDTPGLAQYRKAYDREFNKKWVETSREDLFAELNSAPIIFLADFHALQQSQKAHLRILKGLQRNKRRFLAVEFVEAQYQAILDKFMQGKLSEKEFLKQVSWDQNWGFPWSHYKPILEWARKEKVYVLALNKNFPQIAAKTLKQRDEYAAQVLIKYLQKLKEPTQGIVIFGDLHLASSHLPQILMKKNAKVFEQSKTVFQNAENIFFELLEKRSNTNEDVVRLSRNQFCLMSVPPWVKWQNYLLFLEHQLDQSFDGEDDYDEVDFTDHVARYVQMLAKDLGLKAEVGNFSVYSPQSDLGEDLFIQGQMQSRERKWFIQQMEKNISFFLPQMGFAYLARPTINHAAALAMMVLVAQTLELKRWPMPDGKNFLPLIWLEALQYFGTKLINPKRKTNMMTDLKIQLAAREGGDRGKEALKLALRQKMAEMMYLAQNRSFHFQLEAPYRPQVIAEAARTLGGMLGEKLFAGFQSGALKKTSLMSLIRKPIFDENFGSIYLGLLETVDSFPDPFTSKTEKL